MPWFFPGSESVKKRACRYLLQRYLGQFLQEKISLDQLSVNLYNGKGEVKDLLLDAELINETFESANLPFEIVDGFIGCVSVEIPWSALLSESTRVEIQGLEITLRPKQVSEKSYMLDSMWGSMTKSSMQLAEECLKDEERSKRSQANQFEGLEKIAQAIDIVLTRVKVNFRDIVVRLEQVQDASKSKAVALEARIKKVEYFDEAAADSTVSDEEVKYQPLPVASKCFRVEGITFYTDEYKYPMTGSGTNITTSTAFETSEMFYSTREVNLQQSMEGVPLVTPAEGPLPKQPSGNLVQIAVCHGSSEICLKVKQNSDLSGPKFELNGTVGVMHAILWPKQLEMLRALFGDLLMGREEVDRNIKNELQKPMTNSDYSKIESALQRDFDNRQQQTKGGNSLQMATWAFQQTGQEEEEFFALSSRVPLTEETAPRNQTGGAHEATFPPKYSGNHLTTVNSAKLKAKALILTLIEENPDTSAHISTFAFAELQRYSAEHFRVLSDLDKWDLQDTLQLRDKFARNVPQGHLWFHASTVLLDCQEKKSAAQMVQTVKCSLGTFEAWEHLFNAGEPDGDHHADSLFRLKTVPLCTELLTFPQRSPSDRFSFITCLLVEYEMTEKTGDNLMQRKAPDETKSDLKITMQPAKTDVDITMIDRLSTLFSSLTFPNSKIGKQPNRWSAAPTHFQGGSVKPLNFSLNCSELIAHVRFPVLDLRPLSDRTPWWRRSLHKESLVVNFLGLTVSTSFDDESLKKIDIECRSLLASFQNSPDEKAVPFLKAVMDVDHMLEEGRREEFADCPRMTIYLRKLSRNVVSSDILVEHHDDNAHAMSGSLETIMDPMNKEPSLFMDSRNMVDHEEIICVLPAPASEAALFKDNIVANSEVVVDITVPNVTAFIPDKKTLEILYNRINTDLLLWEPAAPSARTEVVPLSAAHLMGRNSLDAGPATNTFEMCKSSGGDDSDSASDTEDHDYYTDQANARKRINQLKAVGLQSYRSKIPSAVCVTLNIAKAAVGGKIEPEKSTVLQEAWLELLNGSIFSVSGYRGQPEIRYSAIKVQRVFLYYGDYVEPSIAKSDQVMSQLRRPAHLIPVVLPVEEDLIVPKPNSSMDLKSEDNNPMLNIAIAIHVDTFRNVKDIKVALELNSVKLHHRVTLPENLWLTQMIDYINLRDFPVVGYNSPTIITEFHMTISESAAEYKPKFMSSPLRALVTVDKLNISSTIAVDSPQSVLRIITEDLRLHLSKKKQPVSLKDDYVCVVDVPFMEFQVKLSDGTNSKYPRFDFRASNNCCYVRTCSDSCSELSNLLIYLANNGDLNPDIKAPKVETASTSVETSSTTDSRTSKDENVSDEMMDAMKESPPRKESLPKSVPTANMQTSISVFPMAATLSSSMKTSVSDVHNIDDDDFCIIEEDLGAGIVPRGGEPGIKFLTSEPIRIVENHFAQPLAVTDQLRSPDGYPPPAVRFTLKEMSVVWCLYGGKDFDEKEGFSTRKLCLKNRLHSAPANLGKAASTILKTEKSEYSGHGPSWLIKGGPGRDHSVLMEIHLNKVKFQHEQYPFDGKTAKAARQVLFVQDFEIRDRMAASEINKFLYQYVSASMPKQSHASMFSIKALHERHDPALPMEECTLKISLQPLRLNVDQESLFFLSDFFTDVSGASASKPTTPIDSATKLVSPSSSPKDHFPVRTKRLESLEEEDAFLQDALIRFDDLPREHILPEAKLDELLTINPTPLDSDVPVFFKSITFSPEVPIRLDYHGKHVDVERVGALGGLIVGLAQLNCTLLKLKPVHNRQGIRGVDRVILAILSEWLNDIRKTQLANLLAGVGPMHCFVQLVQGVRDLFWLPVEQYRKDGRIVRGVQRGASAFTTSTLIATIELTNRIVQTVQVAAESAYDVISPGPSFRRKRRKSTKGYPKTQPGDIREGVVTAYQVITEGFSDTAREIVDAVSEEHEHKGVTGAVGGALRQIAPAIVKPLILASQATSNVLGGLRNQLQPDFRQDDLEKWRTEDDVRHPNTSQQSSNR